MASITPSSIIQFFKNVPIDSDHTHTLYFGSKSAQTSYFNGLVTAGLQMSPATYQRVNSNQIRCSISADSLYACNYLRFQNANFGTKWFYAFVTGVEYVNNDVSLVSYEVDDLQTWLWDATLEPVLVQRTHTTSDRIGEHTLPENGTLGDYVVASETRTHYFDRYKVITLLAEGDGTHKATNGCYAGIPSPLETYVTDGDSTADFSEATASLSAIAAMGKQDAVVSSTCFPAELAPDYNATGATIKTFTSLPARPTSFEGYVPKNNKLYCYPYMLMTADNCTGGNMELKYENFRNASGDAVTPAFEVQSSPAGTGEVSIYPIGYLGDLYAYNRGLSISNFPHVPFIIDTYRAWLSQGGMANTMQSLAVNAMSGNIAGLMMTGLTGNTQAAVMSRKPDTASGGTCGSALFATRKLDFYFRALRIKGEYARIIDENFTMFGYTINRVMTPILNARPHWTYIKTENMHLGGSIPATAEKTISSYFNAGITFWKNASEVGNYLTLNNSPS